MAFGKVLIDYIHAKNYRGFDSIDVKLNERFNFIVGPNGSGKTSVIRIVSLCLSANTHYYSDSRFGENSEFWIDVNKGGNKHRVGFGKGSVITQEYRKAHVRSHLNPAVGSDNITGNIPGRFTELIPEFAPLIIGASRRFDYVHLKGMQRENNTYTQRNEFREYSSSFLAGTRLPSTKQWLINRYFIIDKEWAAVERQNWNYIIDRLNQVGPTGANLQFRSIKQDLEPLFNLRGKECYLEELSAGYQSVLSMIFSIVEWIEGVNEGDQRHVNNAFGTVVIDELDVHLHPEWQLTIRDTLESLFPNLQFIITTHSPHIIASAKPGEIIVLPDNCGVIDVEPSPRAYSGWSTDQILQEIMQVQSLDNKIYERLVNEALEAVEAKNKARLSESIEDLIKVTHPNDTIVSVLKIRLASLSLEG